MLNELDMFCCLSHDFSAIIIFSTEIAIFNRRLFVFDRASAISSAISKQLYLILGFCKGLVLYRGLRLALLVFLVSPSHGRIFDF